MKCINCGYELTDDAVFCENCGTPVGGEKTTIIDDRDEQYESMSFNRQENAPRYAGEPRRNAETQSAPPQYSETVQSAPTAPPRFVNEDHFYPGTRPVQMNNPTMPARVQQPPRQKTRKKTRKALWISLIALLLVIAILSGIIVYLNFNYVSAAELQEAKDGYRPPAEVIEIDTSLEGPSNDNIKFKFDDRDRIIACSYTVNDKNYDKAYTYDDAARAVEIKTTYKKRHIAQTSIPYDSIRPNEGERVIAVDGEYVSPPESKGSSPASSAQAAVTEASTEAPTEEPLGEIVSVDLAGDEALTDFFSAYSVNSFWMDSSAEYDCRRPMANGQNILACIVRDPTCVNIHPNKNAYPGNGRSLTPAAATNCPWSTGGKNAYTFDKAEVDWICEHIFNIPDSGITAMYDEAYQAQKLWKTDTDYYALEREAGGLGAAYYADVAEAHTDGKYTYVTFNVNFLGQATPYYAVMGKKNIDGVAYWSMYYCSKTIPSTIDHFDING